MGALTLLLLSRRAQNRGQLDILRITELLLHLNGRLNKVLVASPSVAAPTPFLAMGQISATNILSQKELFIRLLLILDQTVRCARGLRVSVIQKPLQSVIMYSAPGVTSITLWKIHCGSPELQRRCRKIQTGRSRQVSSCTRSKLFHLAGVPWSDAQVSCAHRGQCATLMPPVHIPPPLLEGWFECFDSLPLDQVDAISNPSVGWNTLNE